MATLSQAAVERRAPGGDESLAQLAAARYVALERQLTPLLIARRELTHLLQNLHGGANAAQDSRLAQLLNRICADRLHEPAETTFGRLLALTSCELTSEEGQAARVYKHLWTRDYCRIALQLSRLGRSGTIGLASRNPPEVWR